MVRMMSALIAAAAFLSGSLTAEQQPPTQVPSTVASPNTPPAPQPPATRPPGEQLPAPTPTTPTPAAAAFSGTDVATAQALVDRIGKIVDDALDGKPPSKRDAVGTSGSLESKAGKVVIDRAALDEIRAEVALLKAMLHR